MSNVFAVTDSFAINIGSARKTKTIKYFNLLLISLLFIVVKIWRSKNDSCVKLALQGLEKGGSRGVRQYSKIREKEH